MGEFRDLTGKVFGKLTVIERSPVKKLYGKAKYSDTFWICKCSCGNDTIVAMGPLTTGKTRSCGCLQKERVNKANYIGYGEANFNKLYDGYRRGSKYSGLYFDISKDEFRDLTLGTCFYCGSSPSQEIKQKGNIGTYTYNGIDRIDNSVGYTINNCVPCCKICNFMKRSMSKDDFVNHVGKIYNRMRLDNQ